MLVETYPLKRPITDKEKSKMRRAHWILLPTILIVALIIWVISIITDLPTAARVGGYIIGIGAIIIIGSKQLKLDNELRIGEVEVIRGVVTDKIKLGKSKSRGSGGIKKSSKSNRSNTYILKIDDKKYWVRLKTYTQAKKGAFSEMVWLPKSAYVISINEISTDNLKENN